MKKLLSFTLILLALGSAVYFGSAVKAEEPGSQQSSQMINYYCRADINQDGVVNGADLVLFLPCYPCATVGKSCPNSCSSSDFNGDGSIGAWDYFYIISAINAGTTCP